MPALQERQQETEREERPPVEIAERRRLDTEQPRQQAADADDERHLRAVGHDVGEQNRLHHSSISSMSCLTSCFCFPVSLLSRARCRSRLSAAPSKTRSTKSRSMAPTTCCRGLAGR